MTDESVIAYSSIWLLARRAIFSQDIFPTITMAYDTLPHDWSYQGEVMRKKTFGFR